MRWVTAALLFSCVSVRAQDTTVILENAKVTLKEVIVHNHMDYKSILQRIRNDTSFYKAFRNLRVIGWTAFNNITVFDRKGAPKASYYSKTRQIRKEGCRTMEVLEQKTTGDFLDAQGNFNYTTGDMYAGLFFTRGRVCGENNIVAGHIISTAGKSGMDKHREQLKMLFFNPGKKIPGIPFIGNKLDLYDERAHKLYDYRLDYTEYQGKYAYVFTITPKEDLGMFRRDDIVVDNMKTWFDAGTLEVLARDYSLSYKAGFYHFNVDMKVELSRHGALLLPTVLRYRGDFGVIFKKNESAEFTATLFDFAPGQN